MSKKKQETAPGEPQNPEGKVSSEEDSFAERESFRELDRKENFSGTVLWITVATLLLVVSTWTAWFPYFFPESTSAVGLVQTRDVEKLASKITTLEAKIPDVSGDIEQAQIQPFFQPLLRRMGQNELQTEALSDHIQRLEKKYSQMEERLEALIQSSIRLSQEGGTRSSVLPEEAETLIQDLKKAQQALEKATLLNRTFQETVGHFMKAFALYEALETSVTMAIPYRKSFEGLRQILGGSFEEEAFHILASFADYGVPTAEKLIAESHQAMASQSVLDNPTKAIVKEATSPLNRIVAQLKSLVKVRHKKDLGADQKSDDDYLESAHQAFEKKDFARALRALEKIETPTEDIEALKAHTLAYVKSQNALMKIKKHLYSPIFLEEVWGRFSEKGEERP